MQIIYVEDDPSNVSLVERLVHQTGDSLATFPDAESLLRSGAARHADLLLVDIHLPGPISGLDMAAILRRNGLTTPIVIITAYDLPEYVERCRRIGGDVYLVKPVNIAELVGLFDDVRPY